VGTLENNVVFVTGGASGIGRATVDAFVAEGGKVGILDINGKGLAQLAEDHGNAVVTIEGDATSLTDNERAVQHIVDAFGRIDVLATFPGLYDFNIPLVDVPAERLSDAFDESFGVNVKSILLATKAALSQLLATEGSVVITVSTSGFIPGGGGCFYVPSKFAVRGLVKQLAYELAPKIRVNGVAPGGTMTGVRGLRSLGQEEMTVSTMVPSYEAFREMVTSRTPLDYEPRPATHAGAYLYLASKTAAPAVTGEIISSDGGVSVRGFFQTAGFKPNPEATAQTEA
jgi:2,3-dihydroxy-2,3-dihydrophenylpropionate dehydrogenase